MTGGRIYLEGKRIKIKNPADAIKNKIGLVSFENEENGLLNNLNIKENISMLRLKNLSHLGIIRRELEEWLIKSVKPICSLILRMTLQAWRDYQQRIREK